MSATTTLERAPGPATASVLAARRGRALGSFRGADGAEHACHLAWASAEEALVYDLTANGGALCLAWVGEGGGDVEAEAEAVYASYAERAGAERRRLCRAVTRAEAERVGESWGGAA
ncbi:MAG: hypothetical protein GEU88_17255 [Solirubrobacterales bacterium]|nr:hypothetical protein [Solirubrobacterales bacterium]